MNYSARRRPGFQIGVVTILAVLCSSIPGRADIIKFTGFEDEDTWGYTVSGSGGAVSTDTGSTDKTEPSQRILAGTHSYQISGTTVAGAGTTAILDFARVDVSAYESIQLTIRVSSPSITGLNGNDGPDFVKLFLAIDGAAYSATPTIGLFGNSNSIWGYEATKVGTTTAGSPITLSSAAGGAAGASLDQYSTLVINIPSTAHTIDFRLTGLNDANEIWCIDNVSLTGTLKSVPEPSAAVALVGGIGMLCGFQRRRLKLGRG